LGICCLLCGDQSFTVQAAAFHPSQGAFGFFQSTVEWLNGCNMVNAAHAAHW